MHAYKMDADEMHTGGMEAECMNADEMRTEETQAGGMNADEANGDWMQTRWMRLCRSYNYNLYYRKKECI